MAPFDQEFFIALHLAAGGNKVFPDDDIIVASGKPWLNSSPTAVTEFWNARNGWLPTWNLEQNLSRDASLLVDYVRIWALWLFPDGPRVTSRPIRMWHRVCCPRINKYKWNSTTALLFHWKSFECVPPRFGAISHWKQSVWHSAESCAFCASQRIAVSLRPLS